MPLGIAKALLSGLDEVDRRRQRDMQRQAHDLQTEQTRLQTEALRRQLNAPPEPTPPSFDLGLIDPGLQGVQVDPQHVKGIADALVTTRQAQAPTSREGVPVNLLVALNQAAQTGDYSRLQQEFGDYHLTPQALAQLQGYPSELLSVLQGTIDYQTRMAPIGEGAAQILSNATGLDISPDFTLNQLLTVLSGDVVDPLVKLGGATGERGRTEAQTNLARIQAEVAQGNLELARRELSHREIMDAWTAGRADREFEHTQGVEAWKQGFEERKQDFFENLQRQNLIGEAAEREFNRWLQREHLELDQAAQRHRQDMDLRQDARESERHGRERERHDLDMRTARAAATKLEQEVEPVDLIGLWGALGLPGSPPEGMNLSWWQIGRLSDVIENTAPGRAVLFGDLARAAGIDTSGWAPDLVSAPIDVGDGRQLATGLRNLVEINALGDVEGLPTGAFREFILPAQRMYTDSYTDPFFGGLIDGAPSFQEFFTREYVPLIDLARALESGRRPELEDPTSLGFEDIDRAITLIEDPARRAQAETRWELVKQQIAPSLVPSTETQDTLPPAIGAENTSARDEWKELMRSGRYAPPMLAYEGLKRLWDYMTEEVPTGEATSPPPIVKGDTRSAVQNVLWIADGDFTKALTVLAGASDDEKKQLEDWYGVPYGDLLTQLAETGGQ